MSRENLLTWVILACVGVVVAYSGFRLVDQGEGEVTLVAGVAVGGFLLFRRRLWPGPALLCGVFATSDAVKALNKAETGEWVTGAVYLGVAVLLTVGAWRLARPLIRPNQHPPQ